MIMENKDLLQLIGKTIKKIEWVPIPCEQESWKRPDSCPYDDGDDLKITFTDGFSFIIKASYGGYTGKSEDEYPTFLIPIVKEPEGYNGPGMYETLAKWENQVPQVGYPNASTFTFNGEKKNLHTSTLRFHAESLEHAKSLLNLDEVEYVKWISPWPHPTNND